MGTLDRFKAVKTPIGTARTPLWAPGTPRARPRPGPGPPSGVRKNIFSQNIFFAQKWFLLGPGWISGPKKANLDHLGSPKRGHFGPFYPQSGQKGTQKQPKTRFLGFFCSKSFLKGSWMVSRPQKPLETCIRPAMDPNLGHFTHKTAQNDPPQRVFLENFFAQKCFYWVLDGLPAPKSEFGPP